MTEDKLRALLATLLPGYPQGPSQRFQSLDGPGTAFSVRNPAVGGGIASALRRDNFRISLFDNGRIRVELTTGTDQTDAIRRANYVRQRLAEAACPVPVARVIR